MNETVYEDIVLDLPNIVMRWDVSREKPVEPFALNKHMRGFILEAAMKFPMWTFATYGHHNSMFKVFDGRNELGRLSYEWSGRNGEVLSYVIGAERIAKARERGSYAKTKDIKKALKIIAKSFGVKNINELLEEAADKCHGNLHAIGRLRYVGFRSPFDDLCSALASHIMSNWEETKRIAQTNGVSQRVIDELPTHYEEYRIAQEIRECYEKDKGVVVTIHGNDYAVRYKETTTIYGTNDLPEWIKRGVGMLKLVENNNMISQVGFKVNDNSFYVIEKESHE